MADSIKEVTASTETLLGTHPFATSQPMAVHVATNATLYSVYHPGVSSATKYFRVTLDGTTTTFSEADYSVLANLHDDGGSLTDANRLRVVARKLGVGGTVTELLARAQSDKSGGPASGEFLVKTVSGNQVLEIGDAGTSGEDLEVWILDAADITSVSVTANLPEETTAQDVVVCTQAARLIRLP